MDDLQIAMSSLRIPTLKTVCEDSEKNCEDDVGTNAPLSDSTNKERMTKSQSLEKPINCERKALFTSTVRSPVPMVTAESIGLNCNTSSYDVSGASKEPFPPQSVTELSPSSPQSEALSCSPAISAREVPSPSCWPESLTESQNTTSVQRLPTLIVCDDIFAKHKTGKFCQECPERVTVLCGTQGSLRQLESGHLQWENHSKQVCEMRISRRLRAPASSRFVSRRRSQTYCACMTTSTSPPSSAPADGSARTASPSSTRPVRFPSPTPGALTRSHLPLFLRLPRAIPQRRTRAHLHPDRGGKFSIAGGFQSSGGSFQSGERKRRARTPADGRALPVHHDGPRAACFDADEHRNAAQHVAACGMLRCFRQHLTSSPRDRDISLSLSLSLSLTHSLSQSL